MADLPVLDPDPGPTLARAYERLPDHYRAYDETVGFPLYRWLAGIYSQAGAIEALVNRIGGLDDGQSDLTDPMGADEAWLPWLAQLVGVRLDPAMRTDEARDAVQFASSGWRAGTKRAVGDAVRSELTGTRYAQVYDHSVTRPGDGGVWDVLIITRATETPNVPAVLAAAARRGAKPAGVVLHHRAYDALFSTLHPQTFQTFADLKARGTFRQVAETGL